MEARGWYHLASEAARTAGRPWAPYGHDARVLEATTAYQLGDWDDVDAILTRVDTPGPPVGQALLDAVRMTVAAGRGEAEEAHRLLVRVQPMWEVDGLLAITSGAAAIDAYGDAGDLERALAVHDTLVEAVSRIWTDYFQARVRLSALVLGQLADAAGRAGTAHRAGLVASAPDLVLAVERVHARVLKHRRPFGREGRAWIARAHAEHLRLRWLADQDPAPEDELVAAWQAAAEEFTGMGHVFETARSRARLGSVLRAAGRTEEAREHLGAARQTAVRLGAGPLLAELRAVPGARAGESRTAGDRSRSPRGSGRSSRWWRRAGATARSPVSCSSASRP